MSSNRVLKTAGLTRRGRARTVRTAPTGLLLLLLLCCLGIARAAADLSARKMEIVRTPDGQETIFRDSVRIRDGGTLVEAGVARFNEARGIAVISDSVRITSPDAVIRADSAVYFLDAGMMELFDGVEVTMDSLVIEAPYLFYDVGERRVDAVQGLVLRSVKDGMQVSGAKGRYFMDRGVGELDSAPHIVLGQGAASGRNESENEAGGDEPVTATALTMTWFGADEQALLAGEVRVGSGVSALVADSMRYWVRGDTGVAWGSPHLVDTRGGTEGDTVRLLVEDGTLRSVEVFGNASGRYATGETGNIEIAGEAINIRFEQNELAVVEVRRMSVGRLVQRGGEDREPQ